MNSYKINIITLFPDFFTSPLQTSLVGKAIQKNKLNVNLINLRDYAVNKHRQVDDTPYGGGPGMILMVEPIDQAVLNIKKKEKTHSILLTPRGNRLSQSRVTSLFERLQGDFSLSLVCGHYEGVDERVAEKVVEESISIGDFILSGGESAALVLLESVVRFIPDFMGNAESLEIESFSRDGYIEYPHYTRPLTYKGIGIPDVLTSGHHEKIKEWRKQKSTIKPKGF